MAEIKALIGQIASGAALSREMAYEAFDSEILHIFGNARETKVKKRLAEYPSNKIISVGLRF